MWVSSLARRYPEVFLCGILEGSSPQARDVPPDFEKQAVSARLWPGVWPFIPPTRCPRLDVLQVMLQPLYNPVRWLSVWGARTLLLSSSRYAPDAQDLPWAFEAPCTSTPRALQPRQGWASEPPTSCLRQAAAFLPLAIAAVLPPWVGFLPIVMFSLGVVRNVANGFNVVAARKLTVPTTDVLPT